MTISIRDPQVDHMVRRAALRTGKPITTVVKDAMSDYLARLGPADEEWRAQQLRELLDEMDSCPVVDPRSAKEIMDDLYDERGLPK